MTAPVTSHIQGAFFLAYRVEVNVRASAPRIWNLLTDAQEFPRWNSTVTRIEGEIREGAKLRVHVPGTGRVFTPTVSGVVPDARMTWADGVRLIFRGVRVFELRPTGDGSTDFTMAERFSGLMVPFVKRYLPDFRPIFARYASDLKLEAEE